MRGSIEQVRFAAESGWCILNVKSDRGELMTVTGQAAGASAGERVRCRGQWSNHPKYGLQLEAGSDRKYIAFHVFYVGRDLRSNQAKQVLLRQIFCVCTMPNPSEEKGHRGAWKRELSRVHKSAAAL